ncbi:MAG: ribose 5-phosphate isomerase B [Gemmatimonadota bacterium]|nr:ribose 5-phosphate isomerase B [Gemmatimonadota bacterium]
MRLALGADHAGVAYKDTLVSELAAAGHDVLDLGTDGPAAVDYPDFAAAVAEAVARGDADRGVLVCGSAVGVCIAANKVPGIRAAVCHDTYSAAQGVSHDDMNVLCLGERVIGIELARAIVRAFLGTTFSAEDRHRRRLDKVLALEARYLRPDGAERQKKG